MENRLTVISEPFLKPGKSGRYVRCRCICGNELDVLSNNLKKGNTRSCGCYQKECIRKVRYSNKSHGISKHPLYKILKRIISYGYNVCDEWKDDCTKFYNWGIDKWTQGLYLDRLDKLEPFNPDNCIFVTRDKIFNTHSLTKHALYQVWRNMKNHGSNICVEWDNNLENFYDWAMNNGWIKGLCLIKVDNNLGYYPNNCKFVTKEELTKIIHGKFYQGKTTSDWAKEIGMSQTCLSERIIKYGYEQALSIPKKQTHIEYTMEDLLKSLNVVYNKEVIIDNKRADFVLPNNKLIIECNGIYWHSDAEKEDKYYHKNKKDLYTEHGYNSLFFNEDELVYKLSIVKSIIKNKVGQSKKIYARKCVIKDVGKDVARDFISQTHLMGYGQGRVFGLFFNDELVCIMQIINKSGKIEISRFCSKLNYNVVGGFSKLLKHVESVLFPSTISTFIDSRYGSGDYLINLGFQLVNNDISFKWVKNLTVLHRMIYPGNSGYNHGFNKLWDCGQKRYIKKV